MPLYKKIQPIDDFPVRYSVDKIPNRTAENQYQSPVYQLSVPGSLMKKKQNGGNGNNRKADQKPSHQIRIILRKQTEGHPGIAYVRQRKKFVDDEKGMIFGNVGNDPKFGVLIQKDQKIGNQKEKKIFIFQSPILVQC